MKPLTGGSIERHLPTLTRASVVGGLLGASAAILGGTLLVVILYLYDLLTVPYLPAPFSNITTDFLVISALLGLGFSAFGILPGTIGGGLIAIALRERARRGLLSRRISLAVGLGLGAASGASLATLLLLLIGAEGHQAFTGGPVQTVVFTTAIAALAGLAHATLICRWLTAHLS